MCEENQRLKQIEHAHEQLKSEHQQTVERKVLLEEEVRWLKAQYYGRSTQSTDAAEQNPDQKMLFNEAEVLAAIEAADEAWLFSYDAGSAQASANLFSLVMTYRVNEVEPDAYLNYLFEHLPAASTVEQVEALLPWSLKAMLDEQKKERNRQQSAA